MPGLREAGLVGAAIAIAGGVVYVTWNFLSSRQKLEEPVERETEKELSKETPVLPEEKPSSRQVLVLGLDGAGKTSLLHCLATGTLEQNITPTKGFNAVSINKEDLKIEFLEIGGSEDVRAYWKMYLSKAEVLVFVVDSSDPARFPLAKTHLHELIAEHPRLSLVVLANKQDLEGACGITDLHEALSLGGVGDERKLVLIGTHVSKDDAEIPSSVQDARDLIVQMVSDAN
ncbi:ADP-ribosylation factor-like protein 9 isoform X2 [Anguilla anguilla]|uniref:ADP-ribosylation factor-like protein 9 isoform X2 n=1 Tax=Anguilla anguilla TaxID=7936 RepID=UPI0015A7D845|nr:ADP-ribosylation factor-like protein 9 isoform X2 [Anguilla anguilla]